MPLIAAAGAFLGSAAGAATVSAGLGAVSSIYGASQQSKAAEAAAKASKKATDASLTLQRDIYNQNRADQEPWRQAGVNALGQLADPNANFQASPDYAFRMNEGLKGVTQNRAVNGLLNSGSALRGLNDYAQNTASNEFGNWWNRQSGLAGVGQAANNSNANSGSNYANASQNALMQNASLQNQSSYYQANANAQGVNNAVGLAGSIWTNIAGARQPTTYSPGSHGGGYGTPPINPNIWRG